MNGAALEQTATVADAGDNYASFTLSVADRAAVYALPAQVEARFGAVDAVINCAGIIQPFIRLADLDDAVIDRVFDVNFRGTLYMTRAFLPALLKRPEAHIVNVASMGGFLPVPGQTIYGASKAAVKLMTEGLYAELLHTNVHVTIVFPGAVATNIMSNSGVQLRAPSAGAEKQQGSALPANEAARQIVNGIEANKYRVLVGKDAAFLDKLYRLAPQRATEFITKQMKHLLP